jgi:hypothetical protein
MPITQNRMLALISACQDYQQALLELGQRLITALGEGTPETLEPLAEQPQLLLRRPVETTTTLRLEIAHFKRNERRNVRIAEKMRRKRRAEGVLPLAAGRISLETHHLDGQVNYPPASLSAETRREIEEWVRAVALEDEEEIIKPEDDLRELLKPPEGGKNKG